MYIGLDACEGNKIPLFDYFSVGLHFSKIAVITHSFLSTRLSPKKQPSSQHSVLP